MIIDADEIETPDWDGGGRAHNWRRYVGERTRAIWASFTPEQRKALAEDAQDRADLEDWE